ncbi:hypothetical protein ACFX58_00250 [Sphingomonas sp. NCPPB 2930]
MMQIPPVDPTLYRPQATAAIGGNLAASSGAASSAQVAGEGSVRAGVTQATATAKAQDFVGAPQGARSPDNTPSSAAETPNRDWTTVRQKETVKEPEEPPKEPISKLLMDQLQSLWRASSSMVDLAEEQQRLAQKALASGQASDLNAPVVYSDPSKVKRSTPSAAA